MFRASLGYMVRLLGKGKEWGIVRILASSKGILEPSLLNIANDWKKLVRGKYSSQEVGGDKSKEIEQLRAEINAIEIQTKGLVKLEVAALQNFEKSRKNKRHKYIRSEKKCHIDQ